MTINARMLISVLFLMGLAPLWAQNQRLTWEGDEYTLRYEVIIEKEEGGAYNQVLREFTKESFIEVSLSSGKYRCQVIPYDFLNQPIPVTEWMDFEVLSGNAKSEAGEQEIIMVNEAPITAAETEKTIEYKNLFDLYLSAAWISVLPIYQEGMENIDESKFFGKNATLSPFGAAVRLYIVSAKRRFFNPGIEVAATWRIYTIDSDENAQSLLFDCNMIQQSRLANDGIALNFRLGAGVSLVSDGNMEWATGEQYSTHLNIGASLLCPILKSLFMETGMGYSQLFTKDFFCFFRSWIGLGYRF